MAQLTPKDFYKLLKRTFIKDVKSPANRALITECFHGSLSFLSLLPSVPLVSAVIGKEYFAFESNAKLSRAVNRDLFDPNPAEWEAFEKAIETDDLASFNANRITRVIYSVAMSFCCYIDLIGTGDQKTPGTFFEYLVSYLFAWRLGVNPVRSIAVLKLDMDRSLTTDFTFNLGEDRPKIHLPVKTSTRERIIQVWAHQRVLDGVYGTNRFLGTPVILTETKTNKITKVVTEICLPDQWVIYQMHIAQLKRVYYLDMPAAYFKLNDTYPPIHVRPFGEFFFEAEALLA